MLKSSIRLAPRRILTSSKSSSISPRFISTAPPKAKSRSWKNTAVRWVIAIGGIYWYNTSPLFAEEPEASIAKLEEPIHHVQESSLPTLDAIMEEKKKRKLEAERQRQAQKEAYLAQRKEYIATHPESAEAQEAASAQEADEDAPAGAFNPETGEINWDCPCLGGMADGPCGEEFKEAFSCFVFSKEEPKGMDCIDKFKVMQTCFRSHPEHYPAEDEEEEVEEELLARDELRDRESAESEKTGASGPNTLEPSKPIAVPSTSASTTPSTTNSSEKQAENSNATSKS